jgi:uncharacterized membrane protein
MSTYQHSATVQASADDLFAFVSDFGNLSAYLSTVTGITDEQGEQVTIHGEVNGREYQDTGFIRVDRDRRRMEWGSNGDAEYSGWLHVTPEMNDMAEITVELNFGISSGADDMARRHGDRDQAINQGMRDALTSIKNIIEGRGGKVESTAAA